MKKIRNYLLMSLIAICSFTLAGTMKVNAMAAQAEDWDMVCDPTAIEYGDKAKCYIIAKISAATSGSGIYGVNMKNVKTQYLKIDAFNSTLPDVKVESERTNGQNSTIPGNTSFICKTSTGNVPYCFTVVSDSSKLTGSTETTYSGTIKRPEKTYIEIFDSVANYSLRTPVAYFEVSLSEENPPECGKLCVDVDYAIYSTQIDATNGGFANSGKQNLCEEIQIEGTSPPETGSFASYLALATGAVVAIGAIIVSKKQNKVHKI